jgi:tripeptide aminopeptidase
VDRRLIDLFLELAAIEGLSGKERAVADRVTGFLRGLDLETAEDATGNLVCRVGGGGDRALFSHMDTARSTKGVAPRVLDDRIVSDGTTVLGVDNRLGCALILRTVERAVREELSGAGFTAAFTVCEETTLAGSKNIAPGSHVRMAFVLDSAHRPGRYIVRGFGARRFRAEITGRAAHAGLAPERGVDAIRIAARAIAGMPLGRIDPSTTANIGSITGGTFTNVVPETAVLEGEARSDRAERADEIVAAIRSALEASAGEAGGTVRFESRWEFAPYQVPEDSPARLAVEEAIRRAGLAPEPVVSAGGSDANSLNARGIPAVNLGIGAQNPHGNDEFVLLEDMERAAAIAWGLVGGR